MAARRKRTPSKRKPKARPQQLELFGLPVLKPARQKKSLGQKLSGKMGNNKIRVADSLFSEMLELPGVRVNKMSARLASTKFLAEFETKGGFLDGQRLVKELMRETIEPRKGIDYSLVEANLATVVGFMNDYNKFKIIRRKKALPKALRIEYDRQQNHLKSIIEGVRKRGMQEGK